MDDKTQKSIIFILIAVVVGTLLISSFVTSDKDYTADEEVKLPPMIQGIDDIDVEEIGSLDFESDETSMVLTDIAINTEFDYSQQESTIITWRVPVEGEMRQAQFEGIGIKTKLRKENKHLIGDYIEKMGFRIDQNNIITQENMESTGYFRNRTLCKVTQELTDLDPTTGKPSDKNDLRYNVTVACAYVKPD